MASMTKDSPATQGLGGTGIRQAHGAQICASREALQGPVKHVPGGQTLHRSRCQQCPPDGEDAVELLPPLGAHAVGDAAC